jgi:hypothetical protein
MAKKGVTKLVAKKRPAAAVGWPGCSPPPETAAQAEGLQKRPAAAVGPGCNPPPDTAAQAEGLQALGAGRPGAGQSGTTQWLEGLGPEGRWLQGLEPPVPEGRAEAGPDYSSALADKHEEEPVEAAGEANPSSPSPASTCVLGQARFFSDVPIDHGEDSQV